MICTKCNNSIPDNSPFCTYCGAPKKRSGGMIAINILLFIIAMGFLGSVLLISSVRSLFDSYTAKSIVNVLPVYSEDIESDDNLSGFGTPLSETMYEWLESSYENELSYYNIDYDDFEDALYDADFEDFLAEVAETALQDFMYQTGELAEIPSRLVGYMEDNRAVFERHLNGLEITDEKLDEIAELIEASDIMAEISLDNLVDVQYTNPAFIALRSLTSTVTLIVLILLFLACLLGIFFTCQKRLGSTLIQTGAICTVHMAIQFLFYCLFKVILYPLIASDMSSQEVGILNGVIFGPVTHIVLVNAIVLLVCAVICYIVGTVLKKMHTKGNKNVTQA